MFGSYSGFMFVVVYGCPYRWLSFSIFGAIVVLVAMKLVKLLILLL